MWVATKWFPNGEQAGVMTLLPFKGKYFFLLDIWISYLESS